MTGPGKELSKYPPAGGRFNGRGSILLVSLWMLTVLSIAALGAGYRLSHELKLCSRRIEAVQLQGLVDAGLKVVFMKLNEDRNSTDALNEPWAYSPGLFREFRLGDGVFTIARPGKEDSDGTVYGMVDEESKINLNAATFEVLCRVPGITPAIANAILDWRDEDDNPRAGGAEGDYYRHRGLSYGCKNGNFDLPEELMLVKGVTPVLYEQVKDMFTVYGSGGININTAPGKVLKAAGMGESVIETVLAYRKGIDGKEGTEDDRVFESVHDIPGRLSGFRQLTAEETASLRMRAENGMLTVSSTHFSLTFTAALDNGAVRRLAAVIDRKKNIIRQWNEF